MTKQELRSIFLSKRRQLTESELAARSQAICDNFFSIVDFQNIRVVHIFLPIRRNNEPDTWQIIQRLRTVGKGVRISVPRVNVHSGSLEHFYLEANSDLRENEWGIPEIHFGETTPIADIDLVLVPLLVFDLAGNRVGYGKGFYDRFLNQCRVTTTRVGISLFEGVEQIDDIDEFDQPLHYCVTPYDVHAF